MNSKWNIIAFLGTMLVAVGFANFAVSETIIAAFGLVSPIWSVVVQVVPNLLILSFIASVVISGRYYNVWTRSFSRITAVYTGFFVYLLVGSVVYTFFSLVFNFAYLGLFVFGLAVLVSVYGFFNARQIRINKIQVKLQNLPPSWNGKTAVLISDLHLGQILTQKFAQKVRNEVARLMPDILFLAGDLFDGSLVAVKEAALPFTELKVPNGKYFVMGNHEEFRDTNGFREQARAAGFTVLTNEVVNIDGVQVAGVDYMDAAKSGDFQKVLAGIKLDRNIASILLKHEPKDVDVAAAAGVSLMLCGHTHRAQLWPFNYIPKILFKGFDYGLKNMGDTQVYTSSGVGTWGPPMRVGSNSEIVHITFINKNQP